MRRRNGAPDTSLRSRPGSVHSETIGTSHSNPSAGAPWAETAPGGVSRSTSAQPRRRGPRRRTDSGSQPRLPERTWWDLEHEGSKSRDRKSFSKESERPVPSGSHPAPARAGLNGVPHHGAGRPTLREVRPIRERPTSQNEASTDGWFRMSRPEPGSAPPPRPRLRGPARTPFATERLLLPGPRGPRSPRPFAEGRRVGAFACVVIFRVRLRVCNTKSVAESK